VDLSIAALLAQDGVTNGAIYALLALALVMVFAVTRVILVPSGELLTIGALTLAAFDQGHVPGTVRLVAGAAVLAGAVEAFTRARRGEWRRGSAPRCGPASRSRSPRSRRGWGRASCRWPPRWRWRSR
jgi:branched-chain amino acid transport system permease protein